MGGIGLPGGAVYVNPAAIGSRTMRSLTSAAGPIASLLCAVILGLPFFFKWYSQHSAFWAGLAFLVFLEITVIFLNLIPLPGLDGFGIMEPFLSPEIVQKANLIRPFSFFLLFAFLIFDNPLKAQFWQTVGQVIYWVNPDLLQLVGDGYDLFRFWA